MTQEYLKHLSQARNFQDMVRVQTEFMQSMMNAAGEQARSLAEAYTKNSSGYGEEASVRHVVITTALVGNDEHQHDQLIATMK
jgi:hypothetical protein